MDNVIVLKSYEFSKKIVRIGIDLKKSNLHYELASQVLRSGTSIGANIAEAQYAQTDKDFALKMRIALKEASETEYWLNLLTDTEIITKEISLPLINDVKELIRILTSIVKKVQTNNY